MKSSSSGQSVSLLTKVKEAVAHFSNAWQRRGLSADELFGEFDKNVREYGELFEKHTGREIKSAKIVEIGFGARPYRLATFRAKHLNAVGIDLDMPLLEGSISEFLRVARNNGFERALKSITRHYLADRIEQEKFKKHHQYVGAFLNPNNLIIGNASRPDIWQRIGPVDLVTSEDVFEHIPVDELKQLVLQIAKQLSNDGLALICPNIFTGITGGHLLEWYPDAVNEPAKLSEPWEHLRQNRFQVNTYLNRFTRADFRKLFSEHFDILEEIVRLPDLGRQWHTNDVQQELSEWSDEELYSNQVIFVLRKRKHVIENQS